MINCLIKNVMPLTDNSLITSYNQLIEFFGLQGGGEHRNTEFKQGDEWKSLSYKITKALIGLSNLKDGGKVIIGVKDDVHDSDRLCGMSEKASQTYIPDTILEFINKYADPPLKIKMHKILKDSEEKKYFIIINVSEFTDSPTICMKDGDGDILQCGKLYIRPSKRIETSDNFSPHNMRELLDLAIEKYYVKQMNICKKIKRTR